MCLLGRPDGGGETGVEDGGGVGGCLWACLFKVQMLRPSMCGGSQKWQRAGLFTGTHINPELSCHPELLTETLLFKWINIKLHRSHRHTRTHKHAHTCNPPLAHSLFKLQMCV